MKVSEISPSTAADLKNAIDRGDLAAARSAWLPAHLQYERLGAAYDAFGLGTAPDGVILCPDSNAILVRTAESGL